MSEEPHEPRRVRTYELATPTLQRALPGAEAKSKPWAVCDGDLSP